MDWLQQGSPETECITTRSTSYSKFRSLLAPEKDHSEDSKTPELLTDRALDINLGTETRPLAELGDEDLE